MGLKLSVIVCFALGFSSCIVSMDMRQITDMHQVTGVLKRVVKEPMLGDVLYIEAKKSRGRQTNQMYLYPRKTKGYPIINSSMSEKGVTCLIAQGPFPARELCLIKILRPAG